MNDEHTKDLYTKYVTAHLNGGGQRRGIESRAPYLRQVISRFFPKDLHAPVLELGCGHGALIFLAREHGYANITGVDISEEQVAEAKKLGLDNVHRADLIPFLKTIERGSVRTVVAFDVIEHLSKNEFYKLAKDVHRVLADDGEWIIHAPNAASPFFGRVRYGDFTHQLAFTKKSLGQVSRTIGFGKITCYEDVPVVHGVKSALRWILWKCIRTVYKVILAAETGSGDEIFSQNLLAVIKK